MRLSLPAQFPWPPPLWLVAGVLVVGGALLAVAIAMRRMPATLFAPALLVAALWNCGIVVAFMSPHNRHVFHLATHRTSVAANAVVGALWFAGCALAMRRWIRRDVE